MCREPVWAAGPPLGDVYIGWGEKMDLAVSLEVERKVKLSSRKVGAWSGMLDQAKKESMMGYETIGSELWEVADLNPMLRSFVCLQPKSTYGHDTVALQRRVKWQSNTLPKALSLSKACR